MTLSNPNNVVTEQRLHDFYTEILPYLGRVDAGYTPVGSVIIMSGNEAPTNYLACDGTVYNIADYPELAAFYARSQGSCNFYGGNGTTTFAVPDWRGEFIRGAGTNSHANQGNGANVGVHQDGTTIPAQLLFTDASDNRILYTYSDKAATKPDLMGVSNGDTNIKATNVLQSIVQLSAKSDLSNSVIRRTIRPTNTSVLFCVAVKNIYLNPSLDYSTDEKVVGSWIDGKPIYQKTFHYDSNIVIPDDSSLLTVSLANNISSFANKIIKIWGITYSSGGPQYRPLPCTAIIGSNHEGIMTLDLYYADNRDSIDLGVRRSNNTSVTLSEISFTLLYTKTTD